MWPNPSQLSRPVSSGHHLSMVRMKTSFVTLWYCAASEPQLKEEQEKKKKLFSKKENRNGKMNKREMETWKRSDLQMSHSWHPPSSTHPVHRVPKIEFSQKATVIFTIGIVRRFFSGFGVCSDDWKKKKKDKRRWKKRGQREQKKKNGKQKKNFFQKT